MLEYKYIGGIGHLRWLWLVIFIGSGLFAGCGTPDASARDRGSASTALARKKDRAELRRIERDPPACDTTEGCPWGSHCDADTSLCTWQCIADSDCGPNAACTGSGSCVVAIEAWTSSLARLTTTGATTNSDNSTEACQSSPFPERLAALTTLNDDERDCADGDDSCPCGSYCNGENAHCRVDCIAGLVDLPDSIPGCGVNEQCTPLGRCEPSSTTPPPSIDAVTLQISPPVISGNTMAGAALTPVTVTVTANSLDFVEPDQPVTVRYRVQPTPTASVTPRVRCVAGAELAELCDLGGWIFHVDTGKLVSDPQTIWVELPQIATATKWLMDGKSDWAASAVGAVVVAAPVSYPATDPGHYTGTLTWPNAGIRDGTLSVPVEAFVTASHIALYEPSRTLLPDGHVVLARDAASVTMLSWLTAGTAHYDVRLGLGTTTYSADTGQLAGTASYRTGTLRDTPLTLALQRTDAVTRTSCVAGSSPDSCETGSYCEAAMSLCLPGSGPAAGAGIVNAGSPSAVASQTLQSAQVTAWTPSLTTLLSNNASLLAGATPREKLERPYCFQNVNQGGPASFARSATMLLPSDDLACAVPGAETAQQAFSINNRQVEVGVDQGGNAFNLLNDCVAELDATPSAGVPGQSKCVSVARFLLALRPDQPEEFGHRLKTQLLRQWLGVHAYVANTTVQDQQFETVLGATGQSPAARLAQALDRMDQGLSLVLDPSAHPAYGPDGGVATQVDIAPDYRFLRPALRLSFNTTSSQYKNEESGQPISPCGASIFSSPNVWTPQGGPLGGHDDSELQCKANAIGPVGSPAGFSIVLAFDKGGNKPGGWWDQSIQLTDPSGTNHLEVLAQYANANNTQYTLTLSISAVNHGETTWFSFPPIERPRGTAVGVGAGFGLLSIVKNGTTYTLMQALPGKPLLVLPVTPAIGGPTPFVLPQANLAFGSASEAVDELSVWNRPLSPEEVDGMAARYFTGFNGHLDYSHETLPPRPTTVAASEQVVGFPVHMLEAASAELNLARAYVDAQTNDIYNQCLVHQRDALDETLARVGKSLRTVAVIEDEAAGVVAATWSTLAWQARYDADQREVAGRRLGLISTLASLQGSTCKNPLGISEEDLPLYVGSAGTSAAERFFAGSRFLANAALNEIAVAGGSTGTDGLLGQARQAYNAARTSEFQEAQGEHDSADRILRISTDYEDQLKRFCGAPAGEDPAHGKFALLAGFQSGALTSSSCFLKTELPACAAFVGAAIGGAPASCLRGEMGARVLAIQAAFVDADNANHAFERTTAQYDSDVGYCGRLHQELVHDNQLLEAHQGHMDKLRRDKSNWGIVFGILNGVKGLALAAVTHGKAGIGQGIQGIDGLYQAYKERDFDEQLQAEEDSYALEIDASKGNEQVEACMQKAENEKFSIDAARDTIKRAAEQTRAALYALDDDANTVAAVAAQGIGQLTIESEIGRTPPHLHYWLDQSISAYHTHMAYAQRLTYLAVRAYEYESQQSSQLRAQVIRAQLPEDLKTAATTILGATAPFAGRQIDEGPLVLSLRDDILQIADLSQRSQRVGGSAPLTPTQGFKQLLKSDASKIYDQAGHYVGHGIRFALRPQAVDAQTCAERVSRIMPSVTIENASQEITHTRLILAAENTFGSQLCGSVDPGTLQLARIQPSQALLIGDAGQAFATPSAYSTTGLFPLINTPRATLGTMTFPTDDPSAFAGRGRYGNYILIFPDDPLTCTPALCDGWSSDALDKVDDVLLRFDLVEQDNTHL